MCFPFELLRFFPADTLRRAATHGFLYTLFRIGIKVQDFNVAGFVSPKYLGARCQTAFAIGARTEVQQRRFRF
jgi:hypothetical protein